MGQQSPGASEAEILARVVKPEEDTLSAEAARALLGLGFDPSDRQRMHELLVKQQEGELTAEESQALDNYRRVGRLLDLLASKARQSLRKPGRAR